MAVGENGEAEAAEAPQGDSRQGAEFEAEFAAIAQAKDAESAAVDAPELSQDRTDEPAATSSAASPKPAAPAPAAAAAPAAADVWAGVPAEARAQFDAVLHQLKSAKGRINYYQSREAERQDGALSPAPKPAAAASAAAAPAEGAAEGGADTAALGFMGSDAWKKFAEDYPEVAKPFSDVLGEVRAELANTRQDLVKLSGSFGQSEAEKVQAANKRTFAGVHPDWYKVATSDAWNSWLAEQPQSIQDIAIANAKAITNVEDASFLMSSFKRAVNWQTETPAPNTTKPAAGPAGGATVTDLAARRSRQLASATATPSKGVGAASGPPDDFTGAFEHYSKLRDQRAARR